MRSKCHETQGAMMGIRKLLPATTFEVFPLCLGGNVFGWSADETQSFAVLDAFYEEGGNFIDTADVYSEWKEGNTGGDSETIIGKWMAARGNRHVLIIATKVAKYSKRKGLSPTNIKAAADDSLRRLQTDYIDLYYAHEDDESVAQEDVIATFDGLAKAGKIKAAGASNFTGARLRSAAVISAKNNLIAFTALQNHYNIMERSEFEKDAGIAARELGIDSIPFFGLARGFLTGKYKPGVTVESVRAGGVAPYLNDRGWSILSEIEKIASNYGVSPSAVALAWLRAKNQTPIASARTVSQLHEIMQIVQLSPDEISVLDNVSN